MARRVSQRLKIQGTLRVRTPLHVGGFGEDVESDMPLARNGRGQFYVPGTSLAGPIRDWFRGSFSDREAVDALWGFQEKDSGHASYVTVEDAVVELPKGAATEVRDGVGINRVRGTAAAGIKYDRAVIPRGATLAIAMTVELPAEGGAAKKMATNSRIRAMLGQLIVAMKAGSVSFGAARTRGLGRLELLPDVSIVEQTLATRAGILDFLETGGRVLGADALPRAGQAPIEQPPPRLMIEIQWHPRTPVMVKAGFDGIAVDALPLVSGNDGSLSLVLPGSAIKGPLRSHAERVVRTALGFSAPDDDSDRQCFLKQVDVPLVNAVFGSAPKAGDKQQADASASAAAGEDDDEPDAGGTEAGPQPGRGALSVSDCYGGTTITREAWREIVSAEDDERLAASLRKAGLASWHEGYHVAIDRWTGGAAEGALYSVLEPHGAEWNPIVASLDLARIPPAEALAALALLLFVLRDFAEEMVPLGFGTHRGMGWLAVDGVKLTGSGLADLDGALEALEDISLEGGRVMDLPLGVRQALSAAWAKCLKEPHPEVPR